MWWYKTINQGVRDLTPCINTHCVFFHIIGSHQHRVPFNAIDDEVCVWSLNSLLWIPFLWLDCPWTIQREGNFKLWLFYMKYMFL